MSDDNKIISAILSGKFETKNDTYIVEQITDEISRIIKEGSSSFNMLGKVVLEQDGDISRLLVFTDVESVFAIGTVKPKYIETTGLLDLEKLKDLPNLINEAEQTETSLVKKTTENLPDTPIKNKISFRNIKFAVFSAENSGFQVNNDPEGLGIDIVEITSTDIRYAEEIHHKVADAVLMEYDNGSKYVIGVDENAYPVYMSKPVKKEIAFEPKKLENTENKGLLNRKC